MGMFCEKHWSLFEVKGKRRQGQPRKTWKTQVEKESKMLVWRRMMS